MAYFGAGLDSWADAAASNSRRRAKRGALRRESIRVFSPVLAQDANRLVLRHRAKITSQTKPSRALLRAASRLFSTLLRSASPGVDMSVDAARKSACATWASSQM